ncbi:MAG: Eco57I restriction-modification methylase domain-containing protein [Balneolaceae bacterium]|nr:Eco57I restriction-modification methylase domain-containing protein [Balneolaceae bacterium]
MDFFYNKGGSYDDLRGKENDIFRAILDEEIVAKRKELRGFANPRGVQGNLLGDSGPAQSNIDLDEKEKEKLKAEITELEDQKKALGENHPLIWNIEFAEIFFDRGGFDVVIGNPPYVRQEGIGDPMGNLEPKDYKNQLEAAVRGDFPKYFTSGIKISGRSDLYTYFYIRSLRLLNEKGRADLYLLQLLAGCGLWRLVATIPAAHDRSGRHCGQPRQAKFCQRRCKYGDYLYGRTQTTQRLDGRNRSVHCL